jgi:hypothetical protein
MWWAVGSVVGFIAVTGLVVVMARSNTARWERDHRAPQVAARAHGAAMRRAWATTLTRWEHAQERPRRRGARRPHLHLPSGLSTRLPHPHVPHPHLHLPHPNLPHRAWRTRTRRAPGSPAAAPPEPRNATEPEPAGADGSATGASG